jgi:hypothetical protein
VPRRALNVLPNDSESRERSPHGKEVYRTAAGGTSGTLPHAALGKCETRSPLEPSKALSVASFNARLPERLRAVKAG